MKKKEEKVLTYLLGETPYNPITGYARDYIFIYLFIKIYFILIDILLWQNEKVKKIKNNFYSKVKKINLKIINKLLLL